MAASDERMGELVERYAGLGLVSRGDPFATLARSIVGQQISVKAADAVWGRFVAALVDVSPRAVLAAGEEGLAGCGLSRRKSEYVRDLAAHFVAGRLDPDAWAALDDEALIAALQVGVDLQHVVGGDALGDADDELHAALDGLVERIGGKARPPGWQLVWVRR